MPHAAANTTPADARTITYRNERNRAVSQGIMEAAAATFILLIAVRHYDAGPTAKALLTISWSVGMLLTPLVLSWVRGRGWPVARGAAVLLGSAAAVMALTGFVPTLFVFVTGVFVSFTLAASVVPLFTQIYHDNYPDSERGRLFSKTAVIRILTAAVFSWVAGKYLAAHMEHAPHLLFVFAAALAFASFCANRIPSGPLVTSEGAHPLHSLRRAWDDKVFRWTLISWMFMGLGNLVMLPLRVEYLANPRYGITLGADTIAIVVGVLPNVTRLLMTRVWGFLFDRMNFFLLRIVLNLGFLAGILAFFVGETVVGFSVGSLLFGIAMAGGDIAWSLWVTKVAPPDRVAEYMSVHTFFTGIRGVIAPFAAFYLIAKLPVGWLAAGCGVLILIGSALLVPEIRTERSLKRAQPLLPTDEEDKV